jgi:hypothetical protein
MRLTPNSVNEKKLGPERLARPVEQRLRSYGVIAGATLAIALPAHAEVVFTPNHTNLQGGTYEIDLNHDGVSDISLSIGVTVSTRFTYVSLRAHGLEQSDAIAETIIPGFARALNSQEIVKSNHVFGTNELLAAGSNIESGGIGSFFHANNRYLGVKFVIDSQVHYGWVGFSRVSVDRTSLIAHLSGYAYETQPNKPIRAGDTGGLEKQAPQSVVQPPIGSTSLQLLAAGHVANSAWLQRTKKPSSR